MFLAFDGVRKGIKKVIESFSIGCKVIYIILEITGILKSKVL
jgi:hypothetical protein